MRTECTARELSSVRGGAGAGRGAAEEAMCVCACGGVTGKESRRSGSVHVRVAGSLCFTAETGTAV